MKKINFLSLILILVSSSHIAIANEVYQSTTKESKEFINSLLKDSESARWGKVSISPLKSFACVSVNSKNSYGAYEGVIHHVLIKQKPGNSFQYLEAGKHSSHEDCFNFISKREYYLTPEGAKEFDKIQIEDRQRTEARWKEINQKTEEERVQREKAENASWEEYQTKMKQQEQEAELKYQEEKRIRDEEEKVLIEKSKQESAAANQPFNSITNTIKTLESLRNMF